MSKLDDILDRLAAYGPVTQHGDRYRCCCPAHGDQRPSLDVRIGDTGAVLMVCRSHQCTVAEICRAMGITESHLFPDHDDREQRTPPRTRQGRSAMPARTSASPEKIWEYEDENGEILYRVHRLDAPDGKRIWQSLPNGSTKVGDVRRVPYRMSRLLAAVAADWVIVVEGEKCVEAVESIGFAATTNPGGAGKWGKLDPEAIRRAFTGRKVAVLPDNDEPGRKHAADVAARLKGIAAEVRIITLPHLGEKEDVADWVERGGTGDQLRGMIAAAVPPVPEVKSKSISEYRPRPVEWIIPGWLPAGQLTLITGDARAGKSTLLYSIIADLSAGRPCLGLRYPSIPPVTTFLVSVEDDPESKIRPILAAAGADESRVRVACGATGADGKAISISLGMVEELRRACRQHKAQVLVLDPVASLLAGAADDNSDAEIRMVLDPLATMAREEGLSIIMVKHSGKKTMTPTHPQLGSVAWKARARASWLVRRDGDQRILEDNGSSVTLDQQAREFSIAVAGLEKIAELRQHPAFSPLDECEFYELVQPQYEVGTGKHLCGGIPILRWLGDYVPATDDHSPKAGCTDWLRERVGKEFRWLSDDLLEEARRAGWSFDAFKKAKLALKSEGYITRPLNGAGTPWVIGFGDPRRLPPGKLTADPPDSDNPFAPSVETVETVQTVETVETVETGDGGMGNLDNRNEWVPSILDTL